MKPPCRNWNILPNRLAMVHNLPHLFLFAQIELANKWALDRLKNLNLGSILFFVLKNQAKYISKYKAGNQSKKGVH